MRILHLVTSLERRGAQLFAGDIARALAARGTEQCLVILSAGREEVAAGDGIVPVRRLPPRPSLRKLASLRRLVLEWGPDVVFAHGGEPFRWAVLARVSGARPALVYRKIGLSAPWLRPPRALRLRLHRWLLRRADRVCCVSEAVRHELTGLFGVPPGQTSVIYGGVAEEPFSALPAREAAREALGIGADHRVLLGIGALGWEKHQEAMLRALAAVRRAGTPALLLLAGDGPERGRLERLSAELGLAAAVRFLGCRPDVPRLLAASDLVLLTSLTEGLPAALVEAGMGGVPSVAWDVAGVREVVQDGVSGLVPPYRDEEAFAAAVLTLLGDPGRARRMGAAAREFCRERFSLDRCAAEHLRLFRELLGGGP